MEKTKPFNIPKDLFVQAYKLVKANAGAAGVDQETISDFERNLKDNLYKLWNRMASGSYFPPPVRAVPILCIPVETNNDSCLQANTDS